MDLPHIYIYFAIYIYAVLWTVYSPLRLYQKCHKKHLIKKCESVHWCSHYFSFYSNVTPQCGVEIERVHSTFLFIYFNNTTRGYNKRKEKYCEQYTFPLGYIKNAIKCTLSRSVKVFTVLFYLFISITQPGVQ